MGVRSGRRGDRPGREKREVFLPYSLKKSEKKGGRGKELVREGTERPRESALDVSMDVPLKCPCGGGERYGGKMSMK